MLHSPSLARLRRRRPQSMRLRAWHLAALASGAAAALVAGVALLWRFVVGKSDSSSPDRLAATAAMSVAEAARQLVIDAADDGPEDRVAALRSAAAQAFEEAAAAGADVTAAAFGALQGAIQMAGESGEPAIVDAVAESFREAASGVGAGAQERIDQVLRALTGSAR